MARTIRVWTWDVGLRSIDVDDEPRAIAQVLQTVLDAGLWDQLRKFPPDAVRRALRSLRLPAHRRNLVELWLEEAGRARP